jgi:small-conductance mechanosensitive channel
MILLLLLCRSCMMAFHAPFCFGVKTVEPASITSHYVKQEVITLGSMSLNQMWWHIYVCPFVLVHRQSRKPTTNLLVSHFFIISCMGLNCAMTSLTITLQSSVMSTSTFCLLHSIVMVLGWLL